MASRTGSTCLPDITQIDSSIPIPPGAASAASSEDEGIHAVDVDKRTTATTAANLAPTVTATLSAYHDVQNGTGSEVDIARDQGASAPVISVLVTAALRTRH